MQKIKSYFKILEVDTKIFKISFMNFTYMKI